MKKLICSIFDKLRVVCVFLLGSLGLSGRNHDAPPFFAIVYVRQSLEQQLDIVLECFVAETATHEALVAQFEQVLSAHLEDAASVRTANSRLPIQRLAVEEHLFAQGLSQVGQVAVLLHDLVAARIPQSDLAMHYEVDCLNHGVLLEQPVALLYL